MERFQKAIGLKGNDMAVLKDGLYARSRNGKGRGSFDCDVEQSKMCRAIKDVQSNQGLGLGPNE
jgi:hypothetical protein